MEKFKGTHMTHLSKSVRWFRPVGVELTFVPIKGRLTADSYLHGLKRYLLVYDYDQHISNIPGLLRGRIYKDNQCVEHASPILKSWKDARVFYDQATDRAAQAGLTTYRNDQVVGGGGHIHMGGLTPRLRIQAIVDMAHRPYVTYATLTPHDEVNARPLSGLSSWMPILAARILRHGWRTLKSRDGIRRALWKRPDAKYRDFDAALEAHLTPSNDHRALNDKCAWHFRYAEGLDTLEWRAFDSPAYWEIQEAQLALYHRYMAFVSRSGLASANYRRLATIHAEHRFDIDWMVKGFRHLIEHELELPYSEYEWMVERNLEPRVRKINAERAIE